MIAIKALNISVVNRVTYLTNVVALKTASKMCMKADSNPIMQSHGTNGMLNRLDKS
ncbi:hypothetical protein D3C80_1732890 [compost metagenome]